MRINKCAESKILEFRRRLDVVDTLECAIDNEKNLMEFAYCRVQKNLLIEFIGVLADLIDIESMKE